MIPTFIHYSLLWGLLLIGIPVLIHLINMLRHRRVEWAAMECLLVSQKKNRTWIIFKQLLLLLLRMAAIAAVVLIIAGPVLKHRLGGLFGSTKTHHIVLLDDSFSMSDRWGETSAFGEAKMVIKRIGAEAARQIEPQMFTVLRFSRTGRADRGTQPDLLKQTVSQSFVDRLEETLKEIEVSQVSAGPSEAIEAIGQLLGGSGDERRIVYLVSDFRARQWDNPADLRKQLLELNKAEAELHLVNCVENRRPNLAIAALAPAAGNRAAGVPLDMKVTVKNFGPAAARNVSVLLEEGNQARPALTIAGIPPGGSVTENFPIRPPVAGQYLVNARLKSDAVAADNARYRVIYFPVDIRALLIAGSGDPGPAQFLAWTLSPGGSVRTGIRPQIESPRFLSEGDPLEAFQSISLIDLEQLDESAVEALKRYLAAGGGVAIFLGPRSPVHYINENLYREGKGIFPVPLAGPKDLLVDRLEKAPDLQVEPHPIFRVLAGERNSYLDTVIVARYFAAPDDWQPDPDSTTRVIARLRNGAPLVVEQRVGRGRVIAFLTTAAPLWNNWARNPSLVVIMQDLQAYLSRPTASDTVRQVGSKLEFTLDPEEYQKQVRFDSSEKDARLTAPVDAVPTADGKMAVSFSRTDAAGVYQARLTRIDGTDEDPRLYAVNVDAEEGDLKTVSGPQLAARLKGVDYRYEQAAAFQYTTNELAGWNISQWLLYLLIVLLIGEQVLAYSAGYHPPARRPAAKGGVR